MPPITWKNIEAPSVADASRALAFAGQSLNTGFENLKSSLGEYQTGQEKIWKQQDADFTQRQLAKLYAAKTPEELAALQASGELQAVAAPNGARADLSILNKAMDERPALLQTRAMDTFKFNDAVRTNKDAPLLAQAQAALLKKDFAGVTSLASQLSPQGQAAIGKEMDNYQRELVVRAQTDKKAQAELERWTAEAAKWKADTENQKAQIEISRGQLGVAQQNARTQANESRLRTDLAQAARLEKNLEYVDTQIGNADALASSNSGYKKVTDWVATIKDPRKNELLTTALGKARAAGALTGLTSSQTIAALQAEIDTGNWFNWSDNTGDTLTTRLKQFADDPAAATAAVNKAAELQKLRTDLVGRLYPGLAIAPTDTPAVPPALRPGSGAPAAGNSVVAPTPAQVAADAAAAPARPLPPILRGDVDQRVQANQVSQQADATKRNTTRLANEAKLNALREEISGLTPDRINVLTPSEANQVLSKYSQVLAPDLQRLLRKRL